MISMADVQIVLADAGYCAAFDDQAGVLYFEGPTVLGVVSIYAATGDLVSKWLVAHETFLATQASSLRAAGLKVWNVYEVFLSTGAVGAWRPKLVEIEEDLRATRKIARADVVTREDAAAALLPLLPLQHVVGESGGDLFSRLERAKDIPPQLLKAPQGTTPKMLAERMIEEES